MRCAILLATFYKFALAEWVISRLRQCSVGHAGSRLWRPTVINAGGTEIAGLDNDGVILRGLF